MIILKYCNR